MAAKKIRLRDIVEHGDVVYALSWDTGSLGDADAGAGSTCGKANTLLTLTAFLARTKIWTQR